MLSWIIFKLYICSNQMTTEENRSRVKSAAEKVRSLYFKPQGPFTNALFNNDDITNILRDEPDAYSIYHGKTVEEIDEDCFDFDIHDLLREKLHNVPINIPLNGPDGGVVKSWAEMNRILSWKEAAIQDSSRRVTGYTGPRITPKDYLSLLRFKITKLLEICPSNEISLENVEDLYTMALQFIVEINEYKDKISYFQEKERQMLQTISSDFERVNDYGDQRDQLNSEIAALEAQIAAIKGHN